MIERGYAATAAGPIHYRTAGSGPPLLLLHQFPRTSRMYVELMPLLARGGRRVIAMDTLGCGGSAPPPERFDMGDLSRAAAGFLDALGIANCDVFAFHMGGGIAVDLAVTQPELVSRFVIFGYPLIDDESDRKWLLGLLDTVLPPLTDVVADGSHLTRLWQRGYGDAVNWWWHSRTPPTLTPEVVAYMDRLVLDVLESKERAKDVMTAMFVYDSLAALSRLQAPFLHIEADSPFELEICKRGADLARLVPRGDWTVLAGSDPGAAEWMAPELAAVIQEFCAR